VDTNFGRGPPNKIWESKKHPKFDAISGNFQLRIANTSGMDQCNETLKTVINYNPSPIVRKKFGELRSTNKKVIGVNVNPPKWTFSGDHWRASP